MIWPLDKNTFSNEICESNLKYITLIEHGRFEFIYVLNNNTIMQTFSFAVCRFYNKDAWFCPLILYLVFAKKKNFKIIALEAPIRLSVLAYTGQL